jgi:hypothetical protein
VGDAPYIARLAPNIANRRMLRIREISLMEPRAGFPRGRLLEKQGAGNPEGIASNEAAQPAIRLLARRRLRRSLLVFYFDFVHNLLNVRNVLGYLLDGRAFGRGVDATLQSDDALVHIIFHVVLQL